MNEQNYLDNFLVFLTKIKEQNNPSFMKCDSWSLPGDPLPMNGVRIEQEINNKNDRELLHNIGQKNGLIPLCLNDLIGIDPKIKNDSKITKVYVQTSIGKLYLQKQKLNS
jgi:hypothetical protein